MGVKQNTVIVGAGAAGLAAAARLRELHGGEIDFYAPALGGTPYIAAINFALPDNPYGDTPEQYAADMLGAGYHLNSLPLVREMCSRSRDGYELLRRWGVTFATLPDGSLRRRHVSGSTYPRSLCRTDCLVGVELERKLRERLKAEGVRFHMGCVCTGLLTCDGRVTGISYLEKGQLRHAYAPTVIAAWGGVGNLLGASTYPADVNGRTLAIAYEAGAALCDLEFLEYEPLVTLSPAKALGEPCPTAMLGEGAYLLNNLGERFLLKIRPQGEAGSPKTLLNKAIWKEVEAGRGSPNGGVYADLRHIPKEILTAYPWFYHRLADAGCDPAAQLVEVGPMAHSFSGGIRVDAGYASTLPGLYAVGEAAGGIHGACRMAGNAAAQAVLSGLLCAEAAAKQTGWDCPEQPALRQERQAVRKAAMPIIAKAAEALGVYRNGASLQTARETLESLLNQQSLLQDDDTRQQALSVLLMVRAALARTESRGTHMRTDYPEQDPAQAESNLLCRGADGQIELH